ncbi:MAG: Lin0512 family protein [Candidatus Helarchaeota archaeon]
MRKRFITQIGMGVDQHGHESNVTKAAIKAIKNAISNNCLQGLREIGGMTNPTQMIVEVRIAAPYPENINRSKVLRAIPFGRKELIVEKGGMIAYGIEIPELGDVNQEILVVNAAVTVYLDL